MAADESEVPLEVLQGLELHETRQVLSYICGFAPKVYDEAMRYIMGNRSSMRSEWVELCVEHESGGSLTKARRSRRALREALEEFLDDETGDVELRFRKIPDDEGV